MANPTKKNPIKQKLLKQNSIKQIKLLRTELLSRRTIRIWPKMKERHKTYDIHAQSNLKDYKKFVHNFEKKKFGEFETNLRKGSLNGGLILTLESTASRGLDSIEKKLFGEGKKLNKIGKKIRIKQKSKLFKASFTLTKNIEPNIKFPIDITKGIGVCAITNLQGPSKKKYINTTNIVKNANTAITNNWQIFMLRELTEHAKRKGCNSIALLRPEYNVDLTTKHLVERGALKKDADSIRSQYYATARKTGFKKVAGSKYFWIFF